MKSDTLKSIGIILVFFSIISVLFLLFNGNLLIPDNYSSESYIISRNILLALLFYFVFHIGMLLITYKK